MDVTDVDSSLFIINTVKGEGGGGNGTMSRLAPQRPLS